MAIPSILQKSKNAAVYQVQPLKIVLPTPTSASSRLLVIIEGQKSGFPFSWSNLTANTPVPVVSDDKNNVYTKVGQVVNLSQDTLNSPPLSPPLGVTSTSINADSGGFFPSIFAFTTAATTGTQTITVGAFYDDEFHSPPVLSPPQIGGRAVFDGGLQVQVYELASGAGTITTTATTTGISSTIGLAALGSTKLEVMVMMDSSAFAPGIGGTIIDSGSFVGSTSYWAVQAKLDVNLDFVVGSSLGFKNPLNYVCAVLALG